MGALDPLEYAEAAGAGLPAGGEGADLPCLERICYDGGMSAVCKACLALLLACFLALTVAAQDSPTYRLGPKDLLEVRVDEASELNSEARVSDAGSISLPRVGAVSVSGKTAAEAAAEIQRLLEARFLQRATVTVIVKEFRSKPISVLGAVEEPGSLGFSGRWTLLEAITAAGGLSENHGSTIYVLRRAENGLTSQLEIPVKELMTNADPRYNIPIFVNDLIRIPPAVDVTVYCLGEVAQPGAMTFKDNDRITLLAVIASAGGLTDRAASKISIRRPSGSGSGESSEMTVDFKEILNGRQPDVELREGDVVVVKESFF